MSRRRQSLPFNRYSLSPERNKRRVTTISPARNCCWLNLRRRIFNTTCVPLVPAEVAGAGGTTEIKGGGEAGSSSGKENPRGVSFPRGDSTSSLLPRRGRVTPP